MLNLSSLRYDKEGLIPVIVQDYMSNEVLMLGYATHDSLRESLELGKVVLFSRSRNARWLKGETSGNYLDLVSLQADCDSDAVLAKLRPHGPTCHLGTNTCICED